jgi:hypothetical protein
MSTHLDNAKALERAQMSRAEALANEFFGSREVKSGEHFALVMLIRRAAEQARLEGITEGRAAGFTNGLNWRDKHGHLDSLHAVAEAAEGYVG